MIKGARVRARTGARQRANASRVKAKLPCLGDGCKVMVPRLNYLAKKGDYCRECREGIQRRMMEARARKQARFEAKR